MSNTSKQRTRGSRNTVDRLNKVIYSVVVAVIILSFVLAYILFFGKNSDGKEEGAANQPNSEILSNGNKEEKDLPTGNESPNEDKVEVVAIAQDALEVNTTSAKEKLRGATGEEDIDSANEPQPGSATSWFLIFVLTLSTAANGCIAVFIFRYIRERIKLHRERIELLNDEKYVEPEELQKTMRDLSEKTKALDKQLSELKQNNQDTVQQLMRQAREAFTKVEKNSASNLENVEELKSAYLLMRDKLDEKDKEIKRYKEGYDTDKLITSLEGFIKIRDRIDSYAEDGKTTKDDLQRLVEIIENTITTIGAKEIEITVGDNIDDDKYLTRLSVKKEIDTDSPEDGGKIASIEKNGYQITGPNISTVIRKAEIALYKYKTNK